MEEQGIDNKFKSNNPYRVPENYFEQKQKDLAKIAELTDESAARRVHVGVWLLSGIAAALTVGLFFFNPSTPDATDFMKDVNQDEIGKFVLYNYTYEMNEDILLLEMDDQEIDNITEPFVSDEELEKYLEDNYDQTLHYEYL